MLRDVKFIKLNARLRKMRNSYPGEFHRVFQSFNDLGDIKAVELRALLLYIGPYLFKGNKVVQCWRLYVFMMCSY